MTSPEGSPRKQERDALLEAALECYLAAILEIAETLASLYTGIGPASHDQLLRLRSRVAYQTSVKTLEESRIALHYELETFADKARQYNAALADDVAKALALFAQNQSSFSVQHKYVDRLGSLVDQMEKMARSGDLTAM